MTATLLNDGGGESHARVRLEGGSGSGETVRARYVVAADGVRSAVRKGLDIDYFGWQTSGRFLVTDFAAILPFTAERRLWFSPPFYPEGIVLMHSIGEDTWRLDWQVSPDLDVAEEFTSGRVDQRIQDVLDYAGVPGIDVDILRCNGYTFQQRCASSFRSGRVFLVGDAAHVVSPFGARGMNSGMEDVENLAWKLVHVLDGRAPDDLLATYETERKAAAEHNVDVTGNSMRFMTPDTAEGLSQRNQVLEAAASDPDERARVDSGRLYEPFPYGESALVTPWVGAAELAVRPGDPLPDIVVSTGQVTCSLRNVVAGEFSVLRVPAQLDGPLQHCRPDEPDSDRGSTLVVGHLESAAALSAETERAYLVRPDCYVAAVVDVAGDWQRRLADAWTRATGRQSTVDLLAGEVLR